MFGYEVCSCCSLYHLLEDLVDDKLCVDCSSKKKKRKGVALSKPQYEKLYEERLKAVRHFLRPTLPAYPSDLLEERVNKETNEDNPL